MEKSKIKNLIIIVLALVDLFLMVIVINDEVKTSAARQYKIDSVRAVFAENDITIDKSVRLQDEIPKALYLKRDETAEKYRAARLIGDCTTEDLGGNIYCYTGSLGQATFRGWKTTMSTCLWQRMSWTSWLSSTPRMRNLR